VGWTSRDVMDDVCTELAYSPIDRHLCDCVGPGYIMDSSRYIIVSSTLAVPHLPHGYAWYLVVPSSRLCASWDRGWSTHQKEASFSVCSVFS
jgi:hypothetical protein